MTVESTAEGDSLRETETAGAGRLDIGSSARMATEGPRAESTSIDLTPLAVVPLDPDPASLLAVHLADVSDGALVDLVALHDLHALSKLHRAASLRAGRPLSAT